MPEQQIIESFYGINNQADPYSDGVALECTNFDITLGGDCEKTKGYTRFNYATDSVTAIDVVHNSSLECSFFSFPSTINLVLLSTQSVILFNKNLDPISELLIRCVGTIAPSSIFPCSNKL